MSNPANPEEPRPSEPEALTLKWAIVGLVLPVVSYLTVYAILAGKAKFFGIPSNLLSVSLSDVLQMVFALAAFTYILVWMFKDLLLNGNPFHPEVGELGLPLLLMMTVPLGAWWKDGVGTWFWVGLAACGLYILILVVLLTRRTREHGSLRKALDTISRPKDIDPPIWSPAFWRQVLDGLVHLRPTAVLFVVLVVFYLSVSGSSIGIGMAKRDTRFLVVVSQPQRVVLLTANGNVIVGTLGRDGRTLSNEFEVVSLTDIGPLAERELGQLRPSTP